MEWCKIESSYKNLVFSRTPADFAQNFANERRNPTNCYYGVFFISIDLDLFLKYNPKQDGCIFIGPRSNNELSYVFYRWK